jgi:hypothetical protein
LGITKNVSEIPFNNEERIHILWGNEPTMQWPAANRMKIEIYNQNTESIENEL